MCAGLSAVAHPPSMSCHRTACCTGLRIAAVMPRPSCLPAHRCRRDEPERGGRVGPLCTHVPPGGRVCHLRHHAGELISMLHAAC